MNADRTDFFECGSLVLDRYTTPCRRDRCFHNVVLDLETDLHGAFSFRFLLIQSLVP